MAYKAGSLVVDILADDQLTTVLDKLENKIGKFSKKTNRQTKNGGGLFSFSSIAKIGTFIGSMRKVARIGSQILQYGVDYTETLNLWQVAMGDNLSMAQDFVTQMNKAYGISEKTLMNAQAIFKNMLGSLGQISDTMAYNLSEAITQMAIDYSSLYNVSIDSAITKFQAVLAGQVRPIRSISGYDITENTLYQLYQAIGGTKSVRQLSRTEKQLLSILAIYKQMGASGALGDMEKTIDQVANQSRMMVENWKQLATWAGVSLQYFLQQSGVFRTINALLITGAEILKSIAYSLGYETPDFANSWADNVEDTEEAVDDLQGKLLDFDKFRSLNGAEQNVLGIDTKLMEAISGYTSEIGNASSAARNLADQWLRVLGFVDENGDGVYDITEKAKELWAVIKPILITIGSLIAIGISNKIINLIASLGKAIFSLRTLNTLLIGGIIYSFVRFVEAIGDGDAKVAIIAGTIGTLLVGAFVALKIAQYKSYLAQKAHNEQTALSAINQTAFNNTIERYWWLLLQANGVTAESITWARQDMIAVQKQKIEHQKLNRELKIGEASLRKQATAYSSVATALSGIVVLAGGVISFISAWDDMSGVQRAVGIFTALAGALTAVAIAFHATHNWAKAISVGGIVAGGALFVTSQLPKFAEGGLPDKGTMFVAGEAGAEIVYNTPSGQSGVANIQQIEQAMYGALVRYGNSNNGKIELTVNLDGEKVYQNTTAHAKRRGNVWGRA